MIISLLLWLIWLLNNLDKAPFSGFLTYSLVGKLLEEKLLTKSMRQESEGRKQD